MSKYILAFDQGTTSSRCILFNENGLIVSKSQKEFRQVYPKTGWVEHDPMEIWMTELTAARETIASAGVTADEISAIGITNQRETTIVWDKNTGKPVYNAIVWQCRRTAPICDELKTMGLERMVREKTGLIIDPYFSGTKIRWILDNVNGAREEAEKGNLLFGNVDSWLIWNLTNGEVHVTDYTNASRTMLFNIHTLCWDAELLKALDIPLSMMPEVKPSSYLYGYTYKELLGKSIPIAGAAGDQQAALFGQNCFKEGSAKNTYGTGCFMLMNTGEKCVSSKNGLLTTIAWGIQGKVEYALEGSIFIGGAAIQWLRDEMKLIDNASETEKYAQSVTDTDGVYMVPAFVGLGAPYWDPYARGTIVGITRGTKKEHIIRAVLESVAFETYDVLKAMEEDCEDSLKNLKVDGGASANKFLMQFQSDILDVNVMRPEVIETTALGAAYLAGLAVSYWSDKSKISENWVISRTFKPTISETKRKEMLRLWHEAVKRSLSWSK